MNRLHFTIALLLFASVVQAQQLSLFTQYRENISVLNPAAVPADYLAFEQNVSFGATYRAQWTEFAGNPTTQTLQGSYLSTNSSGVSLLTGGHIINDQTGPTGLTGIYGRIGGVISGDPYYGGISLGLTAGLAQFRMRASELRFRDEGDLVAAGGDQAQLYPDVGLGVFAYTRIERGIFDDSYLYGGVSVPQVLGLDLTFRNDLGEYTTERVQHVYGMIGMYKFFRNGSFLEPSVWVKYAPNAPVNVDFNVRYQTNANFWIGTGMSTAQNFHAEAGVIVGDMEFGNFLRIGYGYDYSFTTFGPAVGGTHEINVTYSFAP
jgi:type IX secretion system PorP/SprF family membrane protein